MLLAAAYGAALATRDANLAAADHAANRVKRVLFESIGTGTDHCERKQRKYFLHFISFRNNSTSLKSRIETAIRHVDLGDWL